MDANSVVPARRLPMPAGKVPNGRRNRLGIRLAAGRQFLPLGQMSTRGTIAVRQSVAPAPSAPLSPRLSFLPLRLPSPTLLCVSLPASAWPLLPVLQPPPAVWPQS